MWKETPKAAGFDDVDFTQSKVEEGSHIGFYFLKIVLSNKYMWIMGFAIFRIGVVRNGPEQWFPKYLQEVHNIMPLGEVRRAGGADADSCPGGAIAALAGFRTGFTQRSNCGNHVFCAGDFALLFIFAINLTVV